MANVKGRSVALKTVKYRLVLPSNFMWKNSSPVMLVPYWPKANKTVLLVSNLCEQIHKKPVVIDFYNSQPSGLNIVNQIL